MPRFSNPFEVRFSANSIRNIIQADEKAMRRASASNTRRSAKKVQTTWRRSIKDAGLAKSVGRGLPKSIRYLDRTKGPRNELNPYVQIYSNVPKILGPHQFGALITVKNRQFIAIPAGQRFGRFTQQRLRSQSGKFRKYSPAVWRENNQGNSLVFVDKGQYGLLVDANEGKVQFTLVKSVNLRKRLTLYRDADEALRDADADLIIDWNRAASEELRRADNFRNDFN